MAFLGPERWRPTVYYSSSLLAALAHARRLRGRGGGGRPGGADDLLLLLLRQYVQENLVARPERGHRHGWSGADRRKGPEENECGSLAMAGSWGSS